MYTTRERIRDFNLAFGRPVNETFTELTADERVLIGSLLMEEVMEYCFKGLGLQLYANDMVSWSEKNFHLSVRLESTVDPVEQVDGLADVNVVAHFAAHWTGFNLDVATEIVNDSNMSKLGPDGKAIINGVTPGYREADQEDERHQEPGFDSAKPIGKILKGPNFWEPTAALRSLIFEGNNR